MTPSASVAAWPTPANPGRRGWKLWLAVSAGVLVAQYLAGVFLLWSWRLDIRAASPLTIVRYVYYYGDRPSVQQRLIESSAAGAVLVLGCALAALSPRRRSLHGEARFATRAEVRTAGLLGEEGIILGRLGPRYLRLAGQQGVALAAPPRAGKGVGIVVPNLLHWPDSVICVDIKKENWRQTAGFRSRAGQRCYLFDPFAEDGRSARWNPFFYVSAEAHKRVNDLQRIAEMLYPDPPNVDPFWTASARSLFLGIALYLFETPSLPQTIGEVLRQGMASDDEGFGHHWKRVIEGRNSGAHPLSPSCVRALYDVIDLAPVTASSIRKTFTSRLDLWLNPILDAATSGNDFDLRQLRSQPLSIYVGVNPDDLHRLRPVLSLFFQQAIGLQTRMLPEHDPRLKHQVLMLLDEFTALGRIPIMAEAISYLPGYNVRVLLVIQTPAQLREVYGPNATETMLKSLAARIAFAPKDQVDARELSDELGNTTVKVPTLSKPQWSFDSGHKTRSVSVSEQRRALLLPQELKALRPDQTLILYEHLPPILCKKIRYFAEGYFKKRVVPPPQQAPVSDAVQALKQAAWARKPTSSSRDSTPGSVNATREVTMEDIDHLEQLTLEDLDVDFSGVRIADTAHMSDGEIQLAVHDFMAAVHRQQVSP